MNQAINLRVLAAAATIALLSACASAPAAKTEFGRHGSADWQRHQCGFRRPDGADRAPRDRPPGSCCVGDAARAYTYLTPGYRQTETAAQYADWLKGRQIKWTAGKYIHRQCDDASTCTVSVQIVAETKLPGIPGVQEASSVIEEKWLQFDGVWYHLPKNAR